MTLTYVSDERCTSPMGRISGGQTRWRVLVETWQEDGHYHGRFRFEADDRGEHPRESREEQDGETDRAEAAGLA